jgi:hypothetical protein
MILTPRLRKAAYLAHVTFSVGWLGAVAAYLALAWSGLKGKDADLARSVYLSMELLGWSVIVPLSLAALLSGLVQSLGTEWGLFRHYWITVKFLLSSVGSIILLIHMKAVGQMAGFARTNSLSIGDVGDLRISLVVHAVGGILLLVTATAISVYKPWGMTPYGRRKKAEISLALPNAVQVTTPTPNWKIRMVYLIMGLIVLLLILHHLLGGGLRHH